MNGAWLRKDKHMQPFFKHSLFRLGLDLQVPEEGNLFLTMLKDHMQNLLSGS